MTIERKRPYGAIDEKRLLAFEGGLPSPLPPDYRGFLVDYNGARISACEDFEEVAGGTRVETLFGLHDGPMYLRLDDMRENFKGCAPETFLVIASDPYGNYFGLDLVGARRGAVYFVDHERLPVEVSSLRQVASSFSALLGRIGNDVLERAPAQSVLQAIEQGDADALRSLLDHDVDAVGLVHRALRTGSLEIVRLVLDHGGGANERGGIGGETPLFVAARENRADIARLLLAHGADPDAKCSAGGTAMEMASHWPTVLEVLARAGATPTTRHLREAVRRILGSTP